MLLEFRVENYAVIDQVTVEFGPGLNLLTGETGAGKSILVDALALLLGDKASTDMIRHGSDKALVSCVFEVEEKSQRNVARTLEANGVDPSEDGHVILRREILSSGKSRVFVNNQPATVGVLKQLAPDLASIHAQNESILAFDATARINILDSYIGLSTEATNGAYSILRTIREKIGELERTEHDRLRLVDLWSFQAKEIESARLELGEDTKLETEKRVLANSEKLYGAAIGAYDSLYEGSANAASLLRNAEKQLEELARFDPKFLEHVTELSNARASVEDVSATVRDYAEGINATPERLAEVEDRLALLDRLKRKYGQTVDEVIQFGAQAAQKLSEVETRDEVLKQLQAELLKVQQDYLRHARALSKKRMEAAKQLEKLVEAEINDLAMKVKFKIEVIGSEEESDWSSSGFDSVAYLIATNAGEPLKPIEQIASGGELSRVMLALKASVEEGKPASNGKAAGATRNAASNRKHQRTLVFDEVDTGIGGRAAEAVGKKLKALSRGNQVLCITHLPQIASFADQHFLIEKKESAGRTTTNIRLLAATERTEEIARMLSGAKLTDTSIKHAEQMLKVNA